MMVGLRIGGQALGAALRANWGEGDDQSISWSHCIDDMRNHVEADDDNEIRGR